MSTLDLFKTILTEKDTLPRDQPYKDLISLVNFILRKFFKALAEDSFLVIEVRNLGPFIRSYTGGVSTSL